MPLVLHGSNLRPLVFADIVPLNRAEPLLAGETAEDEDLTLADGDGVSVSRLSHRRLVQDLVLLRHVDTSVLLRRGATTRNKDLVGREGNRSGALVELVRQVVRELLEGPLVLVDIVAQADL